MIVYGERDERVRAEDLLREIDGIADPTERLIRFGQWESAVIDAICPGADDFVDPLTRPLPEFIRIRPQEGFAYYSVYPEQYEQAAAAFEAACSPAACVVIGIRSIGTALSTVVARALHCPVWRFTVRPHGHPFDRRICMSDRLQAAVRSHCEDWFIVVDEGPGLSGSSFASVAEALNELGIPDGRITFLPSHDPDPAGFVSERARRRWPRHRKFIEPFLAERYIPQPARDLSGGLWREVLGSDAAVQPFHERRKYFVEGRLWKYSGLGHYGRTRLARGRELAESGFAPRVHTLINGFLVSDFVQGSTARSADADLLKSMCQYLAHLSAHHGCGASVRYDEIAEMIRVNTGIEVSPRNSLLEEQEAVRIDGRMLPHEWIRSRGGWLKTDALDHHDDHFFPGCQDIAWDIAGAAVEFDLDPQVLVERYSRLRFEDHLRERVAFYSLAYLAYRIGYVTMAEDALRGSDDGMRFRALKRRYTAALEGTIPRFTSRA
jgi:hypothetical protein